MASFFRFFFSSFIFFFSKFFFFFSKFFFFFSQFFLFFAKFFLFFPPFFFFFTQSFCFFCLRFFPARPFFFAGLFFYGRFFLRRFAFFWFDFVFYAFDRRQERSEGGAGFPSRADRHDPHIREPWDTHRDRAAARAAGGFAHPAELRPRFHPECPCVVRAPRHQRPVFEQGQRVLPAGRDLPNTADTRNRHRPR